LLLALEELKRLHCLLDVVLMVALVLLVVDTIILLRRRMNAFVILREMMDVVIRVPFLHLHPADHPLVLATRETIVRVLLLIVMITMKRIVVIVMESMLIVVD